MGQARQAPTTALVNLQHPALIEVIQEKAVRFLDTLCAKHGRYTRDELMFSLMHQLELKPALQRASPRSLYAATCIAAEKGVKFGRTGIWLTVRGLAEEEGGPKVPTVIPVWSYVAKRNALLYGANKIAQGLHIERVHNMPSETYTLEKNAYGEPSGVRHAYPLADSGQRNQTNFIGCYAIVHLADDSRRIFQVTKETIERHKNMTSSRDPKTKAIIGAWVKDWESMVDKTVTHIVCDALLPDEMQIHDEALGLPAGTVTEATFSSVDEEPEDEGGAEAAGAGAADNTTRLQGLGGGPKPGVKVLRPFQEVLPEGSQTASGVSDLVAEVLKEFELAYIALPNDGKSLSKTWAVQSLKWGQAAQSAHETQLVSKIKANLWQAAYDGGYPQD